MRCSVRRRASATGVILVCRQPVARNAGQFVTDAVSETTIAIDLGDGDTRVGQPNHHPYLRNVKTFRVAATAK